MKKTIYIRMVAIAVIAVTATMLCITSVYHSVFKTQIKRDLVVSAKLLKDTHYFENENTNAEDIDLSTNIDELRVSWIDGDGTVIYDNDATASKLQNHANRPEVKEAFEHGTGEAVRLSDTLNKNTYYYAILLDNGTVLRVATTSESVVSIFKRAIPAMLLVILIVLSVCIALSRMLTRVIVEPIETMGEHLGDTQMEPPYRELEPFAHTIRQQHADILSAAKSRQDFTANVSHELKTPLTAISGYAELLESGMVSPDQCNHFYHEIRRNCDRLLTLITDTIRLSELDQKESTPDFVELDLYEVVAGCIEGLKMVGNARNINVSFTGEHVTIRGNQTMLVELVENLVQNAIRYNNAGGFVIISVLNKERPILTVRDNGIGIAADEQKRIFERFYRVDKSRSKETGGTGLGLAIVKHIVELHDAELSLESEPGKGTTIEIQF